MAEYVVFDYMYRDASNYKACGALLLSGTVTEEGRKRLVSKLVGGEFFIAEQIGIRPPTSTSGAAMGSKPSEMI